MRISAATLVTLALASPAIGRQTALTSAGKDVDQLMQSLRPAERARQVVDQARATEASACTRAADEGG